LGDLHSRANEGYRVREVLEDPEKYLDGGSEQVGARGATIARPRLPT